MNYHFIKNKYDIVKYNYNDLFDIKLYYLNENYLQINVKRTDSNDGWGLLLQIKIIDLYDDNHFEIIDIGSSTKNIKNNFYFSKIKLYHDEERKLEIPEIIFPREEYLISNKYDIENMENMDYYIVMNYINDHFIKITIRRLDEEFGWENNVKLSLYDLDYKNRKQIIHVGNSDKNYKILFKKTKIKIYHHNHDYEQEIPKLILQTGVNNNFKNILHFNSVFSFIELNPEYTYLYYNNHNARKFIRQNFNNEVNNSYDILVPGAFKADLLRYCLLYNKGGCYFDCKQILRIPIRNFLDKNKKFVLCNDAIDFALLNAVMFSIDHYFIMEKIIKDCVNNIIFKLGKNPLDISGPTFLYKSIKKYINTDNLLFQNNRPFNNFNDFHIDYYNNNITLFNTNKVIINRFYKGYYNNYLDTTHYGKLYENNEVYYKNIQIMNNYKFLIYPNKNNFKFLFNIIKNILIVKRIDINQGWNNDLKVLIIDKNHNEYLITIGNSDISEKRIEINI